MQCSQKVTSSSIYLYWRRKILLIPCYRTASGMTIGFFVELLIPSTTVVKNNGDTGSDRSIIKRRLETSPEDLLAKLAGFVFYSP